MELIKNILGGCELHNGDCLAVMDALIAEGVKVDAIITDPPYGTTRNQWDSIIPLDDMWERLKKIIKPNGAIALCAQTPFDKILGASNIEMLKYEWIWEKTQGTGHLNAKKMPLKNHENILIFYNQLPLYNPQMREGKPYTCKSGVGSNNYGTQISVVTENNGERYPLSVLNFNHCKNKIHPHAEASSTDGISHQDLHPRG